MTPHLTAGIPVAAIALSEWPATWAGYRFLKTEAQDVYLEISIQFNASGYSLPTDAGTDDATVLAETIRKNLDVYLTIAKQLNTQKEPGINAANITIETTLNDNAPQKLGEEEQDGLFDYINSICTYLTVISEGVAPLQTPATFTCTIPCTGSTNLALFPLNVTWVTTLHAESSAATTPDATPSGIARSKVVPLFLNTTGAGRQDDYQNSILDFASKFEAIYSTEDSTLKLLNAVPNGTAIIGRQAALWVFRMGYAAGKPVEWNIAPQATCYSLLPLANSLLSGLPLHIPKFDAETGLDLSQLTHVTTNGVDIDIWAKTVLAAIQELLDKAPQIAALDKANGSDYLQQLLQVKEDLSTAITDPSAGRVSTILATDEEGPALATAGVSNAAETMRQLLLVNLNNCYAVTAIGQNGATVVSPYPAYNTDRKLNKQPRLYGQINSTGNLLGAKERHFSAANVSLANGASFLSYGFNEPNPAERTAYSTAFNYTITHVDQDVADGKQPTPARLAFILPQEAVAVPAITIPVPVRHCPRTASFAGLDMQQQIPEGSSATALLEAAQTYHFSFQYPCPEAVQDELVTGLHINIAPELRSTPGAAIAAPELFNALGQFVMLLPQLDAIFQKDFIKPGESVSDLVIAPLATAQPLVTAIAAATTLAQQVAAAWPAWVRQENNATGWTTPHTAHYLIRESEAGPDAGVPQGSLLVSVSLQGTALASVAAPALLFDGYQMVPTGTDGLVAYKSGVNEGVYLSKKDADTQFPHRTLSYQGLNVLQVQNSHATLQAWRNRHLVAGTPTQQELVYASHQVIAPSVQIPQFDSSTDIDIAKLSPAGQPAPLWQHLQHLFKQLFAKAITNKVPIKLEVAYAAPIAPGLPDFEIPVLLVPARELTIPADYGPAMGCQDASPGAPFVCGLAQGITAWYQAQQPSATGHFRFRLSLFSDINKTDTPLLHLDNVILHAASVTDLQ